MRTALVVMVVTSVVGGQRASAAPCFPPGGKPRLAVTDTKVTACVGDDTSETCFVVSPGSLPVAAKSPAPRPPYRSSFLVQSNVDGRWLACFSSNCKPMGKAALKAVKAVELDPMQATVDVTMDGQVLVIDKKRAFLLATDRELKPKPPREYKRGKDLPVPTLMDFTVVRSLVIANWYDCAGPCGRSVVVDRKGANVGAWFPRGEPAELDEFRLLIVPTDDDTTATVLDAKTAKQLARVSLGGGGGKAGVLTDLVATEVTDDMVAAMWRTHDGPYRIAFVIAPRYGPEPVVSKREIATCP